MWLLNFTPDWFYHLILLVGILGLVASFVLKFIPFVSQYKLPIQVGALLLTIFGVYMEGGIANEQKWKERVNEAEQKVLAAQAMAEAANGKVITKYVTKTEVVTQNRIVIQKEISDKASDIDANCKVVPSLVDVLNHSASARQGGQK